MGLRVDPSAVQRKAQTKMMVVKRLVKIPCPIRLGALLGTSDRPMSFCIWHGSAEPEKSGFVMYALANIQENKKRLRKNQTNQ